MNLKWNVQYNCVKYILKTKIEAQEVLKIKTKV